MAQNSSSKIAAGVLGIAALASILTIASVASQAAERSALQAPQSINYEHEQIIKELTNLAKRDVAHTTVEKALIVIKAHYAKEEAFVLPPLALLPQIGKGTISKDMEPAAIAMADRTKAALPELLDEHIQITSLMNELIEAGKTDHNEELTQLATRVAIQSLNDIEIAQPTTILIGDYLRRRRLARAD